MTKDAPTIHVVDDDATFRTAMERLLQALGYEVVIYGSAEQLLQTLPNPEASCIISDVRMPGINGSLLRMRLGELGVSVPIIFLTGDTDVLKEASSFGEDELLLKPVTRAALTSAIERALRRYRGDPR